MVTKVSLPKERIAIILAQELQVWMPDGDKGNNNFCTTQEFIDSPIRQDGSLPNSNADCKSFNKVLHQVSKMVVGLAMYLNSQGLPVRDTDTDVNLRDSLITAIENNVRKLLSPSDGSIGIKRDITYEQRQVTLTTNVPASSPIQVLQYDVGRTSMLVFVEGILVSKGVESDEIGSDIWYEVGTPGTLSDTIKFKCSLPHGAKVNIIRLGDLKYSV